MAGNFQIRLQIDDRAKAAMQRAPDVLLRQVGLGLSRGAMEIAREAKRKAPKAHSHLVNSISQAMVGNLSAEVFAGMQYARYVEEGSGPGGWPPRQSLLDWMRVKGIGDDESTAFAIARSIFRKGTPAQPFMLPAAKAKETRLNSLLKQAVGRALAEIGA